MKQRLGELNIALGHVSNLSLLKGKFMHNTQDCVDSQVNRRYGWEGLHLWLQMY